MLQIEISAQSDENRARKRFKAKPEVEPKKKLKRTQHASKVL